jgi:hypothetical protein
MNTSLENTTPLLEPVIDKIESQPLTTPLPLSFDELLLDLKIIASIKEYDKLIITDSHLSIDKPYMLQGVMRYLYGQCRDQAITYIEEIIQQIFDFTSGLLDVPDSVVSKAPASFILRDNEKVKFKFADDAKTIYQIMVQHLISSIAGLQNLKITYMNDIPSTSRIQLIIEKIQNRIQKINNLMKIS